MLSLNEIQHSDTKPYSTHCEPQDILRELWQNPIFFSKTSKTPVQ